MTEDDVQHSVEGAFSPFFVFRAPRKDKDSKEVTDILVPWDDVALIIQVKAQALPIGGGPSRNSLRWVKKNLAKAGRQVAGAVRSIRSGRMTYMENPLRGRVPFPAEDIQWFYGVIVLHHDSAAYDPFQVVPELQETAVPLHVLSFRDFHNLAHFLDTPADLVNYIEERSDILLPNLRPKVHEEEGVFRHWLSHLESLTAFRAQKRGMSFTEDDAKPYAENLRRLVSGEIREASAGAVIDHMIDLAHEQDPSLAPLRSDKEMGPAASVKVATELSKIPRVRRIALGRRYLRVIQLAVDKERDAWKSTHSPKRSDCMLFLASPLPIERRHERRQRLLRMTELLKHYRQVNKALGIATEAGVDAGRSYDFIYLEGKPVKDEEAFLAARELFGQSSQLLSDEPR